MEYQKLTKVSNISQQNNSQTVTNENNKEIPKEIPRERYYLQKKDRKLLIIWDQYNSIKMEYQKIINSLGNTPNELTKLEVKLR